MADRNKLSQMRDWQMPKRPRSVMSDFERQLRAKIAAGGETVYVPDYPRRQPLQGVLTMDPAEMVTGIPFSGDEDYGKLTQTAIGGVSDYMTPSYLRPDYQGPQTGMGPVGDALAGLGEVFQGGSATGPMGAPASVLSQYAGRLPAADRAFGTAGVKVPGRGGLGKGLTELTAEATGAERNALQQRLAAEAGQAGGTPSAATRDQALANLTEAPLDQWRKPNPMADYREASALRGKIEPLETQLKAALQAKNQAKALALREKIKAVRGRIMQLDPSDPILSNDRIDKILSQFPQGDENFFEPLAAQKKVK